MTARIQNSGGRSLYASALGCSLDANPGACDGTPSNYIGTGTDDAAKLQDALNRINGWGGGELIIDGLAALSQALVVYSNTTIRGASPQCGFMMLPNSGGTAIRNANWVSGYNNGSPVYDGSTIVDHDITLDNFTVYAGIYWGSGGNDTNGSQNSQGQWVGAMQLFGVKNLHISRYRCIDPLFSGWHILNAFGVVIEDVESFESIVWAKFQAGQDPNTENVTFSSLGFSLPGVRSNNDGFHFDGPLDNMTITGMTVCSNDDGLALNADDWAIAPTLSGGGPTAFGGDAGLTAAFVGPITNVAVYGLYSKCSRSCVRVYSGGGTGIYSAYGNSLTDNILISGASGYWFMSGLDMDLIGLSSPGNHGRVIWDNAQGVLGVDGVQYFNIDSTAQQIKISNNLRTNLTLNAKQYCSSSGNVGELLFDGMDVTEVQNNSNGCPLIKITGGTIHLLRLSASSWRRDSGLTPTVVAQPFILVTGAPTIDTILVEGVALDRVRNLIQFDSSFTGTISRVIVNGVCHTNSAGTDGVVRNDSAQAIPVKLGTVYTQGAPTENTGTGSITTL